MLLERADELRALDTVLDAGGVLVIEGGAGIGKTSLLRLGSERAARSGCRVLRGTGSELETGFAFGVVRQLFERELAAADPPQRTQWLAGPAAAVRGLLGAPDTAPDPFAVVHGLYWLTVNMAVGQPVLITVDDAHWADPASLRWLAYLATRVDGPGVAVVVALRPAEPASRQGPLAKIRTAAPAIRPALLSAAGVAAIVRGALGAGTPDATCQALREASGGNPFYLGELLRAQSAAEPGGGRLPASEAVARHVEARIRRLDPAALGLAQALAVLGDEVQLRHAMAMTGLDTDPAVRLAAALVRVEVLAAADPPRFLHPVVRAAVDASLGSDERDRMHRAAAHELDRDGAAPGRVAAHLMHVQSAGDAWVAGRLRQAARSSLAAGAPAEAGDQLRRAFAEPPPPGERTGVLRELAAADASAGRQSAAGWLAEALARTSDPRERATIAHELARTYAALFRWVEAVDTTDRALAELGDRDPALAARLEAELAVAGMHDARRAARVVAVMERLRARRPPPDPETAEALAVARAMAGVLTGRLTAEAAGSLDDALRAAEPAAANWDTRAALLWTAIIAECYATAEQALPAMAEAATRGGSARGLIAVYSSLGFCKLRLGALPEADGAARVALRILQEGDFTAGLGVAAIAAEVATEAGELDEAQALLELIPPGPAGVLSVLAPAASGRLSLARGDGQQALTCFEACLAMFGADVWGIEIRDVGYLHARSGAAQAWLLLGDRDQARTLAEAELADARVSGGRRALGIALRVAGLATGGADGLERLSASVDVLRESPALLERAKSIAELGAGLRRAGQRVAARPLLAEALDLAAGCGARPLASRLHAELAAAGGRPRRVRRHGLDALTPSELRVARLAADGQTNRQIAHGLYVTLKTVETHLAHVYAKLGISHRGELPAALAGENLGVPTPTRTAGR